MLIYFPTLTQVYSTPPLSLVLTYEYIRWWSVIHQRPLLFLSFPFLSFASLWYTRSAVYVYVYVNVN